MAKKILKPISGEGTVVEIDETLIDCQKYEKGQILKPLWVFGGIEKVTKREVSHCTWWRRTSKQGDALASNWKIYC